MAILEFFDPTGSIDVRQAHAARPTSLAGKRIAFLTNEQWQAYFALPIIKDMIEADFPGTEVMAVDAFAKGNESISRMETARAVKECGVDAVIIGNAA